MVRKGRMAKDPMPDVERGDPALDRRHDRRDLTPGQLEAVLDAAARSARTLRGLSGADRHMLYLTACATGFRCGELGTLTPESFDLGEAPAITLAARHAKNRRPVRQPLPEAVAGLLRGFLAGKPAGRPVWPGSWKDRAAEVLRVDLAAAGVPYAVEGPDGPLYADFHALRHTFITMLERSGASPKAAQALARHSDIRLTMNRYTHADKAALARAVNGLGLPVSPGKDAPPAGLAGDYAALRADLAALLSTREGADLFAPLFALKIDPPGDSLRRPETETGGTAGPAAGRKPA
jgi:integrase